MACEHVSSHRRHWLPSDDETLKPHPSCIYCGVIKNISGDRGKDFGHYMNVLGRLKRDMENKNIKLTRAQVGLIARELARYDEFSDTYWINGKTQRSIFTDIVSRYTRLNKEYIEKLL